MKCKVWIPRRHMFLHKEARVGTNQLTPLVMSQLIVRHYKIAFILFAFEQEPPCKTNYTQAS